MKSAFLKSMVVVVISSGLSFAAPAEDGAKKIYDTKCAICHGKDGKGSKPMAQAFKVEISTLDLTIQSTQKKKDEELVKITSEGKNKMPAYTKQLKPEEIKLVVQYIRSLSAKKPQNTK